MSMPLSHFVPAYPSHSPCPQVHSLCLHPDFYFKKIILAPGSRILERDKTGRHHGGMFHPHNFVPIWLNSRVYMENFRSCVRGSCMYVLEFPGMEKAFFSPKSFQRTLPPCAPHWCPCLQNVSSLGWGRKSCRCPHFSGWFISWGPSSLTSLRGIKPCPGSQDLVEDYLIVNKFDGFSRGG